MCLGLLRYTEISSNGTTFLEVKRLRDGGVCAKTDEGGGWVQLVVHPLYSPEMRPTPTYGPWLTNMGVPREGVMVGFTQFHLSVVVGGLQPWRCPQAAESACAAATGGIGPFLTRKALGQESIE